MKIYHEGNHSYITDSGTGHLKIQGSTQVAIENIAENKTMAVFNSAGSSELYWRGASGEGKKIETTQTGSIVTGILTATQFVGLVDGGSY